MFHLPLELQRRIYEYDPTYHNYFKKYIRHLLSMKFTSIDDLCAGCYSLMYREFDLPTHVGKYRLLQYVCTDPHI